MIQHLPLVQVLVAQKKVSEECDYGSVSGFVLHM